MDRLDFSKVASDSLGVEKTLAVVFNELLAVYNLLDFDNIQTLSTEQNEENELLFDVCFVDESEATKASNLLHAECMRLRENRYHLSNDKIDETRVIIKMKKL